MSIGGIEFENIMAFQLKCMMANQYSMLANAFAQNNSDMILVACLRLGWNDAFRHTSENIKDLADSNKEVCILNICKNILPKFQDYAKKSDTSSRINCLEKNINDGFLNEFQSVKKISNTSKPLCFGHIQKMFNIAIKLLVCLKLSADHFDTYKMQIKLGEINQKDVYFDSHLISQAISGFRLDTADCPIDSIILNKIDIKKVTWSKIGSDANHPINGYQDAQNKIAKIQNNNNKSNLCYDFENWNL